MFGSLSHADLPTHATSTSQKLTFHIPLQFTPCTVASFFRDVLFYTFRYSVISHSLTSSAIMDKYRLRINQIYLKQAYLTLKDV